MQAGLDTTLLQTATRQLRRLGDSIDRADPSKLVSTRSRMLCAGLACLAHACYRGLGGGARLDEVGDAAAMLALLTKIDDQVIDALDFHGGPLRPTGPGCERALDQRTRAFLQPTLDSIRLGRAVDAQPRSALAGALGRRLQALAASPERLEHLLHTIAFGWEVQVRAVRLLSGDPSRADPRAIAAVSADISGAWLLMITMIGALPEDAARALRASEEAGFYEWGLWIQGTDALADLEGDTAEGLVASLPTVRLAAREPTLWRRAFSQGELRPLYAAMAELRIDRGLMPTPIQRARLAAPLAELGALPEWLAWIHGFLAWRWLRHPLHPDAGARLERAMDLPAQSEAFGAGWARWLDPQQGEPERGPASRQEAPCSAP